MTSTLVQLPPAERFIVDRAGNDYIVFDSGELYRPVCLMPEGQIEDARGAARRIADMLNRERADEHELLRESLRKLHATVENFFSRRAGRWATKNDIKRALKAAARILTETKP